MADHLLDLTTLIEQPTIKINGVVYQILHPDQLGILEFQRLSAMAGRVSELMKKDEHDDEDDEVLAKIIDKLTNRIMNVVPADVRGSLTQTQKLAVAEVFMMLPKVRMPTPRKAGKTAKAKATNRSDGSRLQYDAKRSSAETPTGG